MSFKVIILFSLLKLVRSQETPNHLDIDNFSVYQNISAPNFYSPAVYQVTPPVDHAEGPTWDGRKNVLYFVDIDNGRVFSYKYESKLLHSITLNGDVTPVIPAKNNENMLIVGLNLSLVAVEWDGEKELGNQKVLTSVSPQFPDSRFNDGKADKLGRLWFGTMGLSKPNEGVFYKIDKNDLAHPVEEIAPVNISNGLAWNKANNKLYYIDSPTLQIVEYDFDEKQGSISNKRVSIDLTKYPTLTGVPDGMTIDKDDNIWIALYGGGAVIKCNPHTGQLLQVIPIPARDVTSVSWGGPSHNILFVTTSRRDLTPEQRKQYPAAGSVFAVTNLETKGLPAFNADVVDSIKKNVFANLLQTTNGLLAPTNSQSQNEFQKTIQKKHTNEEYLKPEYNKPLWMTMVEGIRSFLTI